MTDFPTSGEIAAEIPMSADLGDGPCVRVCGTPALVYAFLRDANVQDAGDIVAVACDFADISY